MIVEIYSTVLLKLRIITFVLYTLFFTVRNNP